MTTSRSLDDINSTFTVVEDDETGQRFEMAVANRRADPSLGVVIELLTFSSSLSDNTGNAIELAENASLHPNRQRVYVASPGNGRTSYWTKQEQKYIRRTGRFTDWGAPLPTTAALNRVPERSGLPVAALSTNSAGGAHATALMRALPEGQVTHAYIKSRPNISNHRLGLVWGLGVLVSDIVDEGRFKRASRDP